MMLTHAAACVISMLLQGSSISKQGGSGLPSLSLLRIIVAVTAVTFSADARFSCRRLPSLSLLLSSLPSRPSFFPLTRTHTAACVISMLLQGSSISNQADCGLPSLSLLRIIFAVAAVYLPLMRTHAAACVVSMLLQGSSSGLPSLTLLRIIVAVA